jgi:hypothetical protein
MGRKRGGPPNSKTVPLDSGGSITFSYDFDLFDLSPEDRKFVNGLIDTLRGYADAGKAKRKKPPAPQSG